MEAPIPRPLAGSLSPEQGYLASALASLRLTPTVEPLDCLKGKEEYEEWHEHMNKLNTARVRLGMAAEYLHTDLNTFNDVVIYAARTDEQRRIIEEYGDDAYNAENDEREDLVSWLYKFPHRNLYTSSF